MKNGNPACDLWALPRCQATAKSTGQRCRNIAVKGRRVCYLHGGRSPGAPRGNTNALKTGLHTRGVIARRREVRRLLREARALLKRMRDKGLKPMDEVG